MLLLALFLIPVVLADLQEKAINNYIVKIDGTVLKSVQPTETSSRVLNLSGLGLQALENDAFDNVTTVKYLDLGNNLLSSIPNGTFSKLVNLKHLSLADNKITKFQRSFEGLNHLKTLNISNNPLTSLGGTDLHGLSKSSVIFTKGLALSSINAYAFKNEHGDFYAPPSDHPYECEGCNVNVSIKICMDGDVLKLVELLKDNETLASGCERGQVKRDSSVMSLENLGIAGFERGWYQLDKPITIIKLAGNKIVDITSELLNDLPANIRYVYLSGNKIKRVKSGILKNSHLKTLWLDSNGLTEIETNAFADLPKLGELILDKNLLTNTEFAASLPTSVYRLHMTENRITEISAGSLSGLSKLNVLHLDSNLIQEIRPNELHGLSNLYEIDLSNNRISRIEPETFQHTSLSTLIVTNNSISGFANGTFDNLKVSRIEVGHNKLTNLTESFPDGLPSYMTILTLEFNEIKELEHKSFEKLYFLHYLSVEGNNITKIEPGTFDSSTNSFKTIILDKNSLNEVHADSFRGAAGLRELSLCETGITSIPTGFLKHMTFLSQLDLSRNQIKRLQNGALKGFRESSYSEVILNGVPLEEIEGGLFEDV